MDPLPKKSRFDSESERYLTVTDNCIVPYLDLFDIFHFKYDTYQAFSKFSPGLKDENYSFITV